MAAATTPGLTVFFVIADYVHPDSEESTTGSTTLNVICTLLLLVVAFLVYRNRTKTDPPAWMAKLQDADPRLVVRIGFVLFAGAPLLLLLVMGHRAEARLPKMRDWMSENSWIVNEIVIGFFLLMSLNSLFGS